MAAGTAAEAEARAYRGTGGSDVTPLSVDHQKTVRDRIKTQEKLAEEQARK